MMHLTPVMKQFILHWGEMGGTWGINRAAAQIAALIYLAEESLTAEEISETLSMARSTVSSGLHELQNWGVVRVVQVLGDRRDHFKTFEDAAELFRTILRERKSREIDPMLEMLQQNSSRENGNFTYAEERLRSMLEFLELFASLFEKSEQVSTENLLKAARLAQRMPLEKLTSLASLADRIGGSFTEEMQ